jgi:acetyltransferase
MQSIDAFFAPRTVAIIGATEKAGKVGRTVMVNMQESFRGTLYPVNPRQKSLFGLAAYPMIGAVPERVDLAVIVTPAPTVPSLIGECVKAGVTSVIIITAGFRESGADGAVLEEEIRKQVKGSSLRIIGPNCLGVMNPVRGLNATFAGAMAQRGSVAFLSQSGAMCTAVLDWSLREHVGFSAFASIGSMLDVGWGDLIQYFGDDPHTQSIILYMESVGDARKFLSAAREVALKKPIIVIKAGRSEVAAKATVSHTGSLAGSDDVLDAAFRRSGVLRVDNIADVFYMSEVLGKQPRPQGPRLTILTNAGGPGVLATDSLVANHGELAVLSPQTLADLNGLLPPHWSHANPIDILGDADAERYAKAVEIAAKNPDSDGLLVILTPQAMTDATQTATDVARYAKSSKPILASWMGGASVAAGEDILNRAGIPTFPYPDTATKAFEYMWQYSRNLRAIYETPELLPEDTIDGGAATRLLDAVRESGRTLLTEAESKGLLEAYGFPVVPTQKANCADDAVRLADAMDYPAVLKLDSKTITHKTDVGGVRLNLASADDVRAAFEGIRASVEKHAGAGHFDGVTVQPMIQGGYELILGSSVDSQFGPVLLFGMGGQLVEVYRDHALGLPRLTSTLARRLMERTRIFEALKGFRGRNPVDLAALDGILVRFSRLVIEHPEIKEIEINPLVATEDRILALDARIILFGKEVSAADLPMPAIRPYPRQYVSRWVMNTGQPVVLRPMRPEDEPALIEFHKTLSEQTVYRRYFGGIALSQRTSHERMVRSCFIDYDRQLALVAEYEDQIVAVARLMKQRDEHEAEFSLIVSDPFQGRGLGTEMLRRVIQIAEAENIRKVAGWILPENVEMQDLCRRNGFRLDYDVEEGCMAARLDL